MNRFNEPTFVPYAPVTGKLRDEQIQHRSTWQRTPDWQNTRMATIHRVSQRRVGKTTVTEVNPLDPGDSEWLDPPSSVAPTHKARIMR